MIVQQNLCDDCYGGGGGCDGVDDQKLCGVYLMKAVDDAMFALVVDENDGVGGIGDVEGVGADSDQL